MKTTHFLGATNCIAGGFLLSSIMASLAPAMHIALSPGGSAIISDGSRPVCKNI